MAGELGLSVVPNEPAAASIASKFAVRADLFRRLVPELRARAICISQIQDLDVVQRVRDLIAEIPRGEDWSATRRRVTEELSPFFVTAEDPAGRAAQEDAARTRADLLLRTHGFQAYATTRFRSQMDTRSASGYLRYVSMGDSKVRPEHAALDGVILPKSDPFWQTHYPPWDWGCRCIVVEMEDAEVRSIAETERDLPPDRRSVLSDVQRASLSTSERIVRDGHSYSVAKPAGEKDFAWQPGQAQLPLDAVLARYDTDLAREFRDSMQREQVVAADGAATSVWDLMLAELRQRDPAAADAMLARLG